MKSQRYIARYLFSLIPAVSVLMSGFVPSGYSRSWHLVSSLAAPHPAAAQDGGEGWKPVNTGLSGLNIGALAIDPVNTSTIYAGTGGGMFKSIDGGATWSKVGIDAGSVAALAINFVNPNIIHAGAADGGWCRDTFPLFRSTDGGASWSNANSPADCGGMSLLVMDPTSPNTLYAGSFGQWISSGSIQLWKSTDGGATWSNRFFGNPGLAPYGLVIDPTNPQTLYAPGDLYGNVKAIDSGLFKSTDGGANWSATRLTGTYIRAVAIDPLNHNTLYAGSIDYGSGWGLGQLPFLGMLKSTDGGANWLAINNGLTNISGITAIVVDRDNPSILYIGTDGGVFKSTDGGANWSAFNDGLTNMDIRVLTLAPGNPNTLYAGTSGGVFKIIDNTSTTNPIDDAQFFVRQHYLDFLNREPDPAGFGDWVGVLNACGTNQGGLGSPVGCDRVHVSSGFYRSPEFTDRGYFIYRFYEAALGRLPKYAEFIPDMASISGFQTPAEQQQKISTLADAFMQRPEFANKYAGLITAANAAQFVEKLEQTAGVTLPETIGATLPNQPEQMSRTQLIGKMAGGEYSAAQALRAFVEQQVVYDRFFFRGFVAMQYFGYLRRDPEQAGYDDWVDVLTNGRGTIEPRDYRHMIFGFIYSEEYRRRFSPS